LLNRKQLLGKEGEQVALSHLIKLGYSIEAKNYRCPIGEIDIIAKEKGILVFVEVKTRASGRFGAPEEAVDYNKQQKLIKIALYYLAALGKKEDQEICRFDVVSVSCNSRSGWTVELIKDAFPIL
jgi:putative endonuclease